MADATYSSDDTSDQEAQPCRKLSKAVSKKRSRKIRKCVIVDTSKGASSLPVVGLAIDELHWKNSISPMQNDRKFDITWVASSFFDIQSCLNAKIINKFPGFGRLLHKVNLTRALDIHNSLYPDDYGFYPRTWYLPQQLELFQAHTSKKKKQFYIVKPDEGSQGEGIYLIRDSRDYRYQAGNHVVQEYLSKPLLLDDLKFDLRLYAVLLSHTPLKIYLFKEGMARFCTVPYKAPSQKNKHESFMHLTNYSLNKRSENYVRETESADSEIGASGDASNVDQVRDGMGLPVCDELAKEQDSEVREPSKRKFSAILQQLKTQGYDVDELWQKIEQLVCKTLIAVAPELSVEYSYFEAIHDGNIPKSFQILGFDVILTRSLEPILLELNSTPSLSIDAEVKGSRGFTEYYTSPVDVEIKLPLVTSALRLAYNTHCRKSKREEVTEEAEDKMLYEVYPGELEDDMNHLRLLDRIANVFRVCLGRKQITMGSSAFRSFTRRCRLTGPGDLTNAAFDILFIEVQRRNTLIDTDHLGPGIPFLGFVDLFLTIAGRRYPSLDSSAALTTLLDHCESVLG